MLYIPRVNPNANLLLRRSIALSLMLTLIFTPVEFLITPSAVNLEPLRCEGTLKKALFFCIVPVEFLTLGKWVAVVLCGLVIVGKYLFLSSLILFWISSTMFHMIPTSDGGEQIALCLSTLLLIYSLGGLAETFKKRIGFKSRGAEAWHYVWHLMIKIQMAVVYFQAGIAKLGVESWADGSEIYYDLLNPMFGATGWRLKLAMLIVDYDFILLAITWGTISAEVFISYAIFGGDSAKKVALTLAVLLHSSIAIFLGIVSFSIVMIGGAIYALLPARFAYGR
ncbi:hypothetical protein CEPID_03015 [Corynebacterium epidermidicanis]|uniref:HTTM-like domain-containing protein n=1 Tax=Corynebacterium epidermidicanis TaxID=1050174 RepID=A0A0G3GSF4_9CORY|nr:hypothetical protein CEPID_03015 [Corynebacterium epidermidicanis]